MKNAPIAPHVTPLVIHFTDDSTGTRLDMEKWPQNIPIGKQLIKAPPVGVKITRFICITLDNAKAMYGLYAYDPETEMYSAALIDAIKEPTA